ncbi:hypothetical protein CSQ96_08445 [Janthinobacterium sp. BJB412]|nr:hypothetical protein CSQ96_08445 [Janthinobacterium sp. BJB412]
MHFHTLDFATAAGPASLRIMVAANAPERMRGLLGRPALAEGEGMLLLACRLVHTVGMRYPIDLVYLRRDGAVLKVTPALAPRRMGGCWGADCVLELAAGAAARRGIAPGARLPLDGLRPRRGGRDAATAA